jgi:hypothetical protein
VAELGVPATEVARRAGHGLAVLLKIYAHCIDGQPDAANIVVSLPHRRPTGGTRPGLRLRWSVRMYMTALSRSSSSSVG